MAYKKYPLCLFTIEMKAGIVSLLVLDMDSYAEKYGSGAVRKTITIPAYMNTYIDTHILSLS